MILTTPELTATPKYKYLNPMAAFADGRNMLLAGHGHLLLLDCRDVAPADTSCTDYVPVRKTQKIPLFGTELAAHLDHFL